jgi:hypothetical protein
MSGPAVARLFHRLLGVVAFVAWASLAVQVEVLAGSRGLLPAAELAVPPLPHYPSLFRWIPPGDAVLVGGAWLGAALALVAASGLAPRLLAALQLPLYLSYAVTCRDFLGFQWDNLLLECLLLATLLPRDRPAPIVHLLFRLLLFKLYFESGVAKLQSHLGDWVDGSAMTYYYETAPLPTALARFAHHLPDAWHHFESRATLVLELAVPFCFFGPRALRLAAAILLTGFQLVNFATANYGFFVPLALALHVFLLDDRLLPWARGEAPREAAGGWRRRLVLLVLALYASLSLLEGVIQFADPAGTLEKAARPARRVYAPLRLVNTYHLFGHITRERIEPEVLTSVDGETFVAHPFHWKPGPLDRAPPFVAPHQPRVDFLLWFYGLGHRSGAPPWVAGLLRRVCHDPGIVQRLFATPLPGKPRSVQLRFHDYRFAPEGASGWWRAEPAGGTRPIPCASLR